MQQVFRIPTFACPFPLPLHTHHRHLTSPSPSPSPSRPQSRPLVCASSSSFDTPPPSPSPAPPSPADESKIRAEVTRRIKDLGRQGKARDAVGELAAMARLGVQPDTQSATALLDACMRCKKIEMAESVFQELFNGLLVPDEVTFAVMVRGYGDDVPPRWTAIAQAVQSMEREFEIKPTVRIFNALLEVCSRTNDEVRGAEIIQRMASAGIEPDDFTVEAVRQRKSLRSMLKKTLL